MANVLELLLRYSEAETCSFLQNFPPSWDSSVFPLCISESLPDPCSWGFMSVNTPFKSASGVQQPTSHQPISLLCCTHSFGISSQKLQSGGKTCIRQISGPIFLLEPDCLVTFYHWQWAKVPCFSLNVFNPRKHWKRDASSSYWSSLWVPPGSSLCIPFPVCKSCHLLSENMHPTHGLGILVIPGDVCNVGRGPSAPLMLAQAKEKPAPFMLRWGKVEQRMRTLTQNTPAEEHLTQFTCEDHPSQIDKQAAVWRDTE